MRKLITLLAILLAATHSQAQTEKLFAYKITDYINNINDTTSIVQVQLPDAWPVPIKEKQMGLLKHRYQQGTDLDTASIGWGRCQLIKGDYYYFGLHLYKGQKASEGDLLYMTVNADIKHDGVLLNVMKHAIEFTDVQENLFLKSQDIFSIDRSQEIAILDSMVADICYTAKAMRDQMADQNQPISGGLFDGKKMFDAMEAATRSDVETFLGYVVARPTKYAGHTWKISETFATWMVSGTPRVKNE